MMLIKGVLKSPVFHFVLLALVGLVIYSNTFEVPFLYDDLRFIPENPLIRDLAFFTDPAKAVGLKLEEDVFRYFWTRRIGFLSFWANYRLGGLDVRGFHAINILIHIINSILVYTMVVLSFRTPLLEGSRVGGRARSVALFSGLLFVAHPMQTEAVTYILQRIVLLTSMFYLLSVVSYIRARLSVGRTGRNWLYALSLISAVLAMNTKENAFTLPLAIALCEMIFFRGMLQKRVVLLVPFLLTMLIIPRAYLKFSAGSVGIVNAVDGATRLEEGISRMEYLDTQFAVVTRYIRLMFLPTGQSVDHDQVIYQSFLNLPVFLSFLFLMSVFGVGVFLLYRSRLSDRALRLVDFGIIWFYLALAVESGILPIGEMMVEYRVYLPSAGAFIALGTGAFLLMERLRTVQTRGVAMSFIFITPLLLSVGAHERNTVWKDDLVLWEDVVKKAPNKSRGHINLGNAYRSRNLTDKALQQYLFAVRLDPENAMAHSNLGNSLKDKGRLDEAEEHYQTALRLKPDLPGVHKNLGVIYKMKGMTDRAIEQYLLDLDLKPDDAVTFSNLGNAYNDKGLRAEAIEQFETALRFDPGNAMAHNNLGTVYGSMGRYKEAIENFRAALRIAPDYVSAYLNLGNAYGAIGSFDEAIENFEAALQLKPDIAEAHLTLGFAYQEKGLVDRARTEFNEVLRLDPGNAKAKSAIDSIDGMKSHN